MSPDLRTSITSPVETKTATTEIHAKALNQPKEHSNIFTINTIGEGLEEFFANFNHKEGKNKYEQSIRELIQSGERVLDVSIFDIRSHNNNLMESINLLDYKEAFPHLCKALRNVIIKHHLDSDETTTQFLVRLVL